MSKKIGLLGVICVVFVAQVLASRSNSILPTHTIICSMDSPPS